MKEKTLKFLSLILPIMTIVVSLLKSGNSNLEYNANARYINILLDALLLAITFKILSQQNIFNKGKISNIYGVYVIAMVVVLILAETGWLFASISSKINFTYVAMYNSIFYGVLYLSSKTQH